MAAGDTEIEISKFLQQTIALVVISYHAPRTLLNTLTTWKQSGLLSIVAERIAILNDPFPEEIAIALEFGFQILQPKDVVGSKVRCPDEYCVSANRFPY